VHDGTTRVETNIDSTIESCRSNPSKKANNNNNNNNNNKNNSNSNNNENKNNDYDNNNIKLTVKINKLDGVPRVCHPTAAPT
jgi:hypothetical protein